MPAECSKSRFLRVFSAKSVKTVSDPKAGGLESDFLVKIVKMAKKSCQHSAGCRGRCACLVQCIRVRCRGCHRVWYTLHGCHHGPPNCQACLIFVFWLGLWPGQIAVQTTPEGQKYPFFGVFDPLGGVQDPICDPRPPARPPQGAENTRF